MFPEAERGYYKLRGVIIDSWEAFDKYAEEYDAWYEKYKPVYESELAALKVFLHKIPENLKALEIGIGTGRFAHPFGIKFGLDPSRPMARIAKRRGIETVLGIAELLPFKNKELDLVLIVTALAFFKDPIKALKESFRVLRPGGQLITGILDKDSPQGRVLDSQKRVSKFFSEACFLSAKEVTAYLVEVGFENLEVCQTLFKPFERIENVELPEKGYGRGSFVVFSVRKPL